MTELSPKQDVTGDQLRYAVGANSRRIRLARGLSLRELAERANISAAQLSQIERGQANPTLEVLVRLAEALGTGFDSLTHVTSERPLVVRAGSAPKWIGPVDNSIISELFSSNGLTRFDIRHALLPVGCVTSDTSHGWGTLEYAVVMAGEVEVRHDRWSERLRSGDAIQFVADANHAYATVGDEDTQLLVVIAFPENWLPPEQQPQRDGSVP
ncbi:XRE family transcriptional regulator [Branchiibius hedensis]|uniref:Cupin domain-containing protein n=1 Tax=Branchiibius hedensis TaxID=672460 RepID=A0A2Y8ZUV5_9MICO|nr:XRE family transcriptional regulator [Branchiibius hedensis]PWJ26246.1 XRE family transcriptional regulator [Branchiibius hedensis]SSA35058.1 Cupin domain-containing protein [Branchiibius hedensis]